MVANTQGGARPPSGTNWQVRVVTAFEIVLVVVLVCLWLVLGLCKAAARGDRQLHDWNCPDFVEDKT